MNNNNNQTQCFNKSKKSKMCFKIFLIIAIEYLKNVSETGSVEDKNNY